MAVPELVGEGSGAALDRGLYCPAGGASCGPALCEVLSFGLPGTLLVDLRKLQSKVGGQTQNAVRCPVGQQS